MIKIIFGLALLYSISIFANDSFLGHAKDRGILISITTDKVKYNAGDKVKFQGVIKVSNKGQPKDKDNKNKNGLLEEFRSQGIDIVATYPSDIFNISSAITLQSLNENEISFSFETSAIQSGQENQFSLKVFNNHQDKEKLKKLSQIKAKLEKRKLALNGLLSEHHEKHSSQEVITYLEKEIAKIETIIQKISTRINSDENLMAENTSAFQVDNATASVSRISTIMNRYRFVIETEPGAVIEGSPIKINSKIVNLRKSDQDYDGDSEDDESSFKSADFILDRHYLFTSTQKKMTPGSTITYSYESADLNPSQNHIFSILLFNIEKNRRTSRIGSLSQNIVVLEDNVASKWADSSTPSITRQYVQNMELVNMTLSDEFGRVDPSSIKAKITGSGGYLKDLSQLLSIQKIGDGQAYKLNGDFNPLPEGDYVFEVKAQDLAGNFALPDLYLVNFKVDRTPPKAEIRLASALLTNKNSFDISVFVTDLSPTLTQVYVNDVLAFSTGLKQFPATVNLNLEGRNIVKVKTSDAAGNVGVDQSVEIIRDTIPAVLTITTPLQDDYVNGIQFNIVATSNEAIASAKVNGASLSVGADKVSVSGVFTSLQEGSLTLNFETTDLAGNISVQSVSVNVVLKALNPELLSLQFDSNKNKLIVKGAAGATRPGIIVVASCSLFNSNQGVGRSDGSFAIELNPCSDVEVSAYDPLIDRTEKVNLHFGSANGIALAGIIHDINEQPLPNAKVTLSGPNISVFTNENGIFNFTQAMFGDKNIYGDQSLVIDGRTITQGTGTAERKFSIVQVAVTISLNEKNVLQRPIYLAPVLIDGTETQVKVTDGAVVTSPHAPGVELNIPAGSAIFPDGAVQAAVSVQEIDSTKSTILPIQAAMPKTVVALEPSGTTFSQPVELTLPNRNEFPADAELVILLMNSKTGKWEVGGSAVVSPDGGSIVTKAGQGIRHFSLAYAAPIGATFRPVGAKDKPGANTFDGAVTSKISTPSFKSLGESVSVGLTYKSAWAKPTALVTNLFDMSTRRVDVTVPTQTGSLVDKVKVNLPYCSLKSELFGSKPTADDIKCYDNVEEFLYNIQYKISYKNTQSVLAPDKIVASFQTGNLKTPDNDPSLIFTGLPDMAAISYAMELKDPITQEYFPSGIHPYTAHYDLHFKEMTIGTRVIEQKINLGEPQISEESFTSEAIDKIFPQDLVEPLYVQNYTNSEAGRGWRVDGVQKIVNTSGDRIMIEGESGDIATYSLANVIDTIADLSGKADLTNGVGLNNWPYAMYMNSTNSTYQQIDLTNQSVSTVATPQPVTGQVSGFDYYNFTKTVITQQWECTHHDWLTRCDEYGWKYYYTDYPSSSCSKNRYSYSIASKPSQFLMGSNQWFSLDFGRSAVYKLINDTTLTVGGRLKAAPSFSNGYQLQKDDNNQKLLNFCNSTLGMSCAATLSSKYDVVNQNYACGAYINSFGNVPDTVEFNNPMGMTFGNEPNTLVIADTGHHIVKLLDITNGVSKVIAGTGRVADSTSPGIATSHDIYYPRGVVYDSFGNLYISSKGGYVRKMDQYGNIQIIAGDPINGKIIDSGDAREMKLVEPYGMVIDSARNFLYVADSGQNRVVRIDLSTLAAQTVAGNRVQGFSGDGKSALEASLNAPSHLGLDPNGNLLIADSGNNRIRRVVFQPTNIGTLVFAPTSADNSKLYRNSNGTWTRAYRNGTVTYFDTFGRQYLIVDPVGLTTEILYNADGFLSQIKDPVGQIIQYSYSGNRLSSITDPAGRSTNFSYSSSGNLIRVNFPDGSSKKYDYDSSGLLISETNERNAEVKYIYNAQNRVEKIIKPDTTDVQLSDTGSKTTGGGELKKLDAATNSVTDSNGNSTILAKDFLGYISTITDAQGRVTKIKRDMKGRPIEVTDVDGSVTQNTYDSTYGDLISSKNVTLDISTSTQFNVYGQIISQTDPYGNVTIKTYDNKKLLIKEVMPDGKYLTYEYNSLGLISKKSAFNAATALKNQLLYEYNSKGQLVKQTDLNSKFSSYTYDLAGNVLTSSSNIDSNTQSTTQFQYDEMNRLVKVISPKGEVTEYNYLPTSELLQIKDPKQKMTKFDYNLNGQLTKKTDPQGQAYVMTYDNNGNLLTETDPANQLKIYSYNQVNKITKVQTADDVIQYKYNVKDEVVQIANNTSTINYVRDAKQRVVQESVSGFNYPAHFLNIDYSKNDLRTAVQSNFQNIVYSYTPDSYQLIGLSSSTTGNYGFSYDDTSRLASITRPGSRSDFTFDAGSNLTKISHSANGVEKSFHEFNYDLRNYIVQKRSPSSTLSFGYDLNGQLLSSNKIEDATQNEVFSYDALGNRLTYNGVTSTYDNSGQQIQDDGQFTYVFDANGNIIYKTNKANGISYAFEYSALNQLKKATVTSTPLGGTVLKNIFYRYDPLGRRISRHVIDSVDTNKTNLRKFYYDASNIIAELDVGDNLTATYTHSPLREDDILGAQFTSFATPSGAASAGQVLASGAGNVYYLKDHLNTVNEITNASGSIIQRMDYTAYGVLRSVKNASGDEMGFTNAPIKTLFTFTGREFEPELGMYYYRARYYDPSTGRFLQKDPDPGKLVNPITFLSKYVYVGNNPVMFSDPSGRFFQIFIGAIIGAIVGAAIGGLDAILNGGNFLEKVLRGAIGGALFGAAIAFNPLVGGIALGVSMLKAGATTGNFFENFNRNIIADGALALIGSAISTSVDGIAGVNKYVPLFNPILDAAFYSNFLLIPKTVLDTIKVGCDSETGSWHGGDLCRL